MDALFAVGVGIYSNDFLVPKQNKQDIEKLFNFFEFMDKLSGSQKNHLADFESPTVIHRHTRQQINQ